MPFQIPENLDDFSISGLTSRIAEAQAEYDATFASVEADTVTDEQLDYLSSLQTFVRETGPAALERARAAAQAQRDRTARFSALGTEPEPVAEPVTEPTTEPALEGEVEPVVASSRVPLSAVIANSPAANTTTGTEVTLPDAPRYSSLVAAAGVPNYEAGTELTTLDLAKAFIARSAGHGRFSRPGSGPVMYPVAQLVRNYPDEFSVNGDETDYDKLMKVIDESRLPGGNLLTSVDLRRKDLAARGARPDALVAAAGWCAPSETDYSICLQITTDGMFDVPEVQARRGGIRHNTGIEFDEIFGGGSCSSPTGFFDLTEAQVESGTTKSCLEIPCPDFEDTRLGVTGLCLTGNILSIRGYPEYTAAFTRGSLAAHAHQVNREQIADVVSGSTAVDLSGAAPWATDVSVISQVFSAVEMAIVDIKYKLRLQRSATLEVVMPWWILAQMRADWMRRQHTHDPNLTDAMISNWFSTRGARVQYVYDWQDAFATCAVTGSPGAATAVNNLPVDLQFLVYPAGTWVRAVSDVITLNSVYDSTKLATNQVTHLFTETGWAMARMCPVSRAYTVPICPSGRTSAAQTITCPS